MKRIIYLVLLLGFLCFLPIEVGAYEEVSCSLRHTGSFGNDGNSSGVLLGTSGKISAAVDPWPSGDNAEVYLYDGSSWRTTQKSAGNAYETIASDISYSVVADYRLALYVKDLDTGNDYYCADGVVKVYAIEQGASEVTGGDLSWLGVPHRVNHDDGETDYIAPYVWSISEKTIGGLRYTSTFAGTAPGNWAGHGFQNPVLSKEYGTYSEVRSYFSDSSDGINMARYYIFFPYVGAWDGSGYYVEGTVSSLDDIQLYTRDPVLPPPCCPNPPGTTVFGYVKCDTSGGSGIPEATVNATAFRGGAGIATDSVATNADGSWAMNFSSSVGVIDEVRLTETNSVYAPTDTGPAEVIPGSSDVTVIGNNAVNWANPPSSAGTVYFYDTDCSLPTATPTPAPIVYCPISLSQELGDGPETLGTAYEWVQFTAMDTGYVDKMEVKVANAGGAGRVLTCKVTSSDGSTDILNSENSVFISGSSPADWRVLDYKGSEFFLEAGLDYRLECKSSDDFNNLVWTYNNITNGVAPNGKTYRIFECPSADPVLDDFVITNESGTTVVAEVGGRNQICDDPFWSGNSNSRRAVFEVTIDDGYDGANIDDVRVRFRTGSETNYVTVRAYNLASSPATQVNGDYSSMASFYTSASTSTSGTTRTVSFPIEFETDFADSIYDVWVYAENESGQIMDFVDGETNRDIRIWNCEVDVSGTVYDASDEGQILCPSTGFTTEADAGVYDTLTYVPGKLMTKIGIGPSYEGTGSDALLFGQDYVATFTNFVGTGFESWLVNLDNGTSECSGAGFNLSSLIDGYQTDPRVQIDFSSVINQDSWWQVEDSGANAGGSITNKVPESCYVDSVCRAAVSIGGTADTTGSVGPMFGSDLSNLSVGADHELVEGKDWYLAEDAVSDFYSYDYFYQSYFSRLGVGVTYSGLTDFSDIVTDTGGTGVVFVNGDVNIDTDNSLLAGQFFMLVSSGEITVDMGISAVAGVFVADDDFTALGDSDDQLVVSGIVYSNRDVNLSRSFVSLGVNNTAPAVKVNYDPSLIFKMPGRLMDSVSLWREGT